MQITGLIFASILLLGVAGSFPYRYSSSEEKDYRGVTYIRPRPGGRGGGGGGGFGGRGGGREEQRRVNANGGFRSVPVPTAGYPGSRRMVLLTSPNVNSGRGYGPLRNTFAGPEPQLVRVVLTPDLDHNDGSEENNFGLSQLLSLLLSAVRGNQASPDHGNNNQRGNDYRGNRNSRPGGNRNSLSENDRYGGFNEPEGDTQNDNSNHGRNRNNGQSGRRRYSPDDVSDRRRPNKGSGNERDRPSPLNERERPDQALDYRSRDTERIQDQGDYSYDYEDINGDPYDTQHSASNYENYDKSGSQGNAQDRRNQSPNYDSSRQGNFQNSPSERRNKINRNEGDYSPKAGNSPRSISAAIDRQHNFDQPGHKDNTKCSQNCRLVHTKDSSRNPIRRYHDDPRETSNKDSHRSSNGVPEHYEDGAHDSRFPQSASVRNERHPNIDRLQHNDNPDKSGTANNYEPSKNPRAGYRDDPREIPSVERNRHKNRIPDRNTDDSHSTSFSQSADLANGNQRNFDGSQHKVNADARQPDHADSKKGLEGEHRNDQGELSKSDMTLNADDSLNTAIPSDESRRFGIGSGNRKVDSGQREPTRNKPYNNRVGNLQDVPTRSESNRKKLENRENIADPSVQRDSPEPNLPGNERKRQNYAENNTPERFASKSQGTRNDDGHNTEDQGVANESNVQNRRPAIARKSVATGPVNERDSVNKDNANKPMNRDNPQNMENAKKNQKSSNITETTQDRPQMSNKDSKTQGSVTAGDDIDNPRKDGEVADLEKAEPTVRKGMTNGRNRKDESVKGN